MVDLVRNKHGGWLFATRFRQVSEEWELNIGVAGGSESILTLSPKSMVSKVASPSALSSLARKLPIRLNTSFSIPSEEGTFSAGRASRCWTLSEERNWTKMPKQWETICWLSWATCRRSTGSLATRVWWSVSSWSRTRRPNSLPKTRLISWWSWPGKRTVVWKGQCFGKCAENSAAAFFEFGWCELCGFGFGGCGSDYQVIFASYD